MTDVSAESYYFSLYFFERFLLAKCDDKWKWQTNKNDKEEAKYETSKRFDKVSVTHNERLALFAEVIFFRNIW